MKYLTGAKNPHIAADLASGAIGLMQTPQTRYALAGAAVWAMDNGCFTESYPGDSAFLALLERYSEHAERCMFATAPDVVGDASATLTRSLPMLVRIRALGYPAALVAQDGLEHLTVPWDDFDVLFIGGTTEWKLGLACRHLIAQARQRGKAVHVGRVNSRTRYDRFKALGCDSCDGTFLAFGPSVNAPRLRSWLTPRPMQLELLRYALTRLSPTGATA